MYVYRFCVTTSCVLFFAGLSAMDVATEKGYIASWLTLSYEYYEKKQTLLHTLPNEVHAYILSLVNPKSVLDDWRSNHAVCVQSATVPCEINHLYMSGNRVAYLTPQNSGVKKYLPGLIDLDTGSNRIFNIEGACTSIPKIGICGQNIIIKCDDHCLYTINPKYVGKYTQCISTTDSFTAFQIDEWACHSVEPLCIMVRRQGSLYSYYIFNSFRNSTQSVISSFHTSANTKIIVQWLPTSTGFVSFNGSTINIYNSTSGCCEICINFPSKDSNKFDFFIDTECLYVQDGNNIIQHDITTSNWNKSLRRVDVRNQRVYSLKNTSHLAIRGVSDSFFLAEDDTTQKNGNGQFSLNSLHTDEVIPMSSFTTTANTIHRLPLMHDNRYIVVQNFSDLENTHARISVYVPYRTGLFEHYCMFKAALTAQELDATLTAENLDNAGVWDLFMDEKYKNLIAETAERYAFFKKLMRKNNIEYKKGY